MVVVVIITTMICKSAQRTLSKLCQHLTLPWLEVKIIIVMVILLIIIIITMLCRSAQRTLSKWCRQFPSKLPPPLSIPLLLCVTGSPLWLGPSRQASIRSKHLLFRIVQHDVRWRISTHELRFPKLCSPWSHLWKVGHSASNQSLCEHTVFQFVLGIGNSFAHPVKAAESFQAVFIRLGESTGKIWTFSWLLHFSIAVIAEHVLLKMFTLEDLLIADVDCLYC